MKILRPQLITRKTEQVGNAKLGQVAQLRFGRLDQSGLTDSSHCYQFTAEAVLNKARLFFLVFYNNVVGMIRAAKYSTPHKHTE